MGKLTLYQVRVYTTKPESLSTKVSGTAGEIRAYREKLRGEIAGLSESLVRRVNGG